MTRGTFKQPVSNSPAAAPPEPVKRKPANYSGSGAALGEAFARLSGGGPMDFDSYERAIEAKKRAQARERERYGLKPAPYVDSGCEGEPKPK